MEQTFIIDFIHQVGKIGKQWGLSEPAGRVWGVLLFNKQPLCQREIADKSEYSPGLVSTSLKILEQLGMVSITPSKGREKHYEAKTTLTEGFVQLLKRFIDQDLKHTINTLSENRKLITEVRVKKRVDSLMREYQRLNSVTKGYLQSLSG